MSVRDMVIRTNQDTDSRHGSQFRFVRTTDLIITEFTHVTVTSCTTVLHHTSGQVTTTATDTGYAFFRLMFTDMYTMERHTTATTISGIVLTEDIT